MKTTKLAASIIILMSGMTGGYLLSDPTRNAIRVGSGELLSNHKLHKDLKLAQQSNEPILKGMNDYIDSRSGYQARMYDLHGRSVIQNIRDYSVKITSKCSAGTGWFLDYEIPKEKKYPTKWFIATNAHVISDYKFKSNPYKQVLPIGTTYDERRRACLKDGEDFTQVVLFKDTSESQKGVNDWLDSPEIWSMLDLKRSLYPTGYIYAKNAAENDSKYLKNIKLVYAELKDPKLFYAPINFLGNKWEKSSYFSWKKNNYYKDFAVLEVNFENEEVAKRITDNFYEKKRYGSLDFFKDELMARKGGNQLKNNPESYFVAGYPGNSFNQYRSFGNYSSEQYTASQLASWEGLSPADEEFFLKNKHSQKIIGHVDVGKLDKKNRNTTIVWNGEIHHNWGYNYILDNMRLGPGASGSLVTARTGEVLGLYRMYNESRHHGYVEPLRSKGYYRNSTIVYPKYDLIKGSTGQLGSYKQQLDIYFPNIKTHLRNIWTKS